MFYNYIHNLRGIIICLVVFAHAISTVSIDNTTLSVLRAFSQNASVLFVVIGGYLFSELNKNFCYKSYLQKKTNFVFLPYIICSIPAILVYVSELKHAHAWVDLSWLSEQHVGFKFIYFIITGSHLGPYWFIPMIMLFYLLSPVFHRLSLSKHFIFYIFFSTVLAGALSRPELNSNNLHSFVYFVPAFMFGQFLSINKTHLLLDKANSTCLFLFITTVMLIVYYNVRYSHSYDIFLKLIWVYSIFSVANHTLETRIKHLGILANFSFAIFFIHGYFIAIARNLNPEEIFGQNLMGILIIFLFTVSASVVCATIGKLILGDKSKYIIGC